MTEPCPGADAERYGAELIRRRQLGGLVDLDAGRETLDEFVTGTWLPTYVVTLAPRRRQDYAHLYDHHIAPDLGAVELRELRPQLLARWQADRLADGGGPVAVRRALELLGEHPAASVRGLADPKQPPSPGATARRPRRAEVRPLAPLTVERMRAAASPRDASLFSVLAHAGLRPGEALSLAWADVREKTL